MLDRALLARYLRQRAELGERELMLDRLTARELLRILNGAPGTTASPAGQAGAATATAPATAGEVATGDPAAAAGPRHAGASVATDAPVAAAARHSGGAPESRALDASARAALLREVLTRGAPAAAAEEAVPVSAAMAPDAGAAVPPSRPRATPLRTEAREPLSPAASALQVLSMEVVACTACRLAGAGRRQTVFGRGDATAELVVVGEAPGQEEDRTGQPFVGRAGKLLDLLLLTAGFPRDAVYICNTLKCRPPQNRNPLPDELAACSRFLKAQLAEIQPRVLLAVGKFAALSLVGIDDGISRLRGRVFSYEGIPLVVSYHPAFLLRSPQWTRTAWEDFQLVRKVLDEQA